MDTQGQQNTDTLTEFKGDDGKHPTIVFNSPSEREMRGMWNDLKAAQGGSVEEQLAFQEKTVKRFVVEVRDYVWRRVVVRTAEELIEYGQTEVMAMAAARIINQASLGEAVEKKSAASPASGSVVTPASHGTAESAAPGTSAGPATATRQPATPTSSTSPAMV